MGLNSPNGDEIKDLSPEGNSNEEVHKASRRIIYNFINREANYHLQKVKHSVKNPP